MDAESGPAHDSSFIGQRQISQNVSHVESLNQCVDEIFVEVDQLEQKLNEVEHFYSKSNEKHPNMSKGGFPTKDKDREKFLGHFNKRQQESARREADGSRRKQDLMRQFENIFFQMTQHKWATPFMNPVDVVGLGLHDYYENESTLWKLKLFVKDTLQAQMKSPPKIGGNYNSNGENNQNANNRRKREICDVIVKSSQKKNKKLPTG